MYRFEDLLPDYPDDPTDGTTADNTKRTSDKRPGCSTGCCSQSWCKYFDDTAPRYL